MCLKSWGVFKDEEESDLFQDVKDAIYPEEANQFYIKVQDQLNNLAIFI